MRPERIVLIAGGSSMIVGAISGLAGMILESSALKSAARVALGLGVTIGFLPLLGFLVYAAFSKISSKKP
jgi:hypothetical protein